MPSLTGPVLAARLTASTGSPRWAPARRRRRTWPASLLFGAPVDGYRPPRGGHRGAGGAGAARPGPRAGLPTRRTERPRRGLVWAHGGAFIGGDLDMPEADVVARELASARVRPSCPSTTGCATAACTSRCRTTTSTRRSRGPPRRLASARGRAVGDRWRQRWRRTSPLGVAQRLRDEGGPTASAVLLAYPVVARPGADRVARAGRRGWPTCPPCCGSRRRRRRS